MGRLLQPLLWFSVGAALVGCAWALACPAPILTAGPVLEMPGRSVDSPGEVDRPGQVEAASVPAVRVPVYFSDQQPEVDALRAEVARLRSLLEQQSLNPSLAEILKVPEQDLVRRLDRSELLPDAGALGEALRVAGHENVWAALRAEGDFYMALANFKAKNPREQNPYGWRDQVWAPFYTVASDQLCKRLYELKLPSSVVEPFRVKLNEGI